jgi:hypothetical protein
MLIRKGKSLRATLCTSIFTSFSMRVTLLIVIMLIVALKLLYHLLVNTSHSLTQAPSTPITKEWWDGLSEEWKTILIINQNFQKQGVNIFTLQKQYMHRLNSPGEAPYSEMNTSLNELHKLSRFELSYADFYELAIRQKYLQRKDSINLETLSALDTIYMVSGPGDLTPLEKFPHLTVLILNYCGLDFTAPDEQKLDLEPLKHLKELKVLHCTSVALHSLTPLKSLVNLEELLCDNSSITSLSPIKNLINLKRVACGPKISDLSPISHLINLEELYLQVGKHLPTFSRLKKLKKLTVLESELALIDGSYRINDLDFLKDLQALEYLDLYFISYKGHLYLLNDLQHLKAVTVPPVSSTEVRSFEKANKDCKVINSFQFGN